MKAVVIAVENDWNEHLIEKIIEVNTTGRGASEDYYSVLNENSVLGYRIKKKFTKLVQNKLLIGGKLC